MNALDLIKASEGCRLTAYRDTRGVLTIGWGYTGQDVVEGMTWTQEQADAALLERYDIACEDAAHCVGLGWGDPTKPRPAAIIDMAYNLGRIRLGMFHHMIAALQAEDWQTAEVEALSGPWHAQVGRRANRDADILLTGNWPIHA